MRIQQRADILVRYFQDLGSCAVAFSGGVDSALVAKAAFLSLGEKAVAVTAVSESLASGELEIAERVAKSIGIAHHSVFTDEISNPDYLANDGHRCWHCKTTLYDRMRAFCNEHAIEAIANGTILEDLGDYRPGLLAAQEHRVLSPLAELELTKPLVRELAEHWNIEVWDKPASPCLSSRVAYGIPISVELLNRIDTAEAYLKSLGLAELRVRCHENDLVRIEVPEADFSLLFDVEVRQAVIRKLKELGFKFLTLDLEGLRSGSLNQLVTPTV